MNPPRDIVVVGTALAGLRAAEALREVGFSGNLTLVGDEDHLPYDRPPLSKQVMLGTVAPDRTTLPQLRRLDAYWRRGFRATRLDREARAVLLEDGSRLRFDRLLVSTGARSRPWPQPEEARLAGVFTLRTREDAATLRAALDGRPSRVVVIGGGFTGSEIASSCRALGLPVTLVERGEAPLAGALGSVVGSAAATLQRAHGIDLRCNATVERLVGDAYGHVRAVHLEGVAEPVATDCVVTALGAVPNVEWLAGSGLLIDRGGLCCDAGGRVFDRSGVTDPEIFAAGDVASVPHPLFGRARVRLEHWGHAVGMARVAAKNMISDNGQGQSLSEVPAFWSSQFDVSIKCVGLPALADEVMVAQGSLERGAFVALYGRRGRLVGAVTFDEGKWLPHYEALIAAGAAFPVAPGMDASDGVLVPAGFPGSRDRLASSVPGRLHHPRTEASTIGAAS